MFNYRQAVTVLTRPLFRALTLFAAAMAIAYLALFFIVKSDRFQEWLKAEIAGRTGYEVTLRDLRLKPPLGVVTSAIAVSKSSKLILEGEQTALTLSLFDLFSKTIHRLQLRKPTLYLDVHGLFDSSVKASPDIAIRHLSIEDGTLVLETGKDGNFDFRSVNVNAENLNLEQTTGLKLRAEIPWLEGHGDIHLRGAANETQAEIRILQASPGKVSHSLTAKRQPAEVFTAEVRLRKDDNRPLEFWADGKLDGLKISNEHFNGQFDFRTSVDDGFKVANFAGKFTSNLPSHIGAISLRSVSEPVLATVEGDYSIPEKRLNLKRLHLESGLGNADGQGSVDFTSQPVFSKARLNLRVALEPLKWLLPEKLRQSTYSGTVQADLELQGSWPSLAIKGVARSDDAHFKSEQISLSQLSVKAPFEWMNGWIRARDVRIKGKMVSISQKMGTHLAAEELRFDGGLEKKLNEAWKSSGKLQIVRGRFATTDGSKVGENLTVTGRFDATVLPDKGATSISGKVDLLQGEILWGKFFSDLKIQQPTVIFDGNYVSADDTIRLRRFDFSLTNIGQIAVTGSIGHISESPVFSVEVKSDNIQSAGAFEFFVRERLNRSYPIINELSVAGRLSFSVRADGPLDNLSAQGNARLRAGDVRAKSSRWQVGLIDLILPFRVRWPGANSEPAIANPPTGTLIIESARFGAESIPTLKTTFSFWNNALQFQESLRIPIYGGTVGIRNLAWKNLIRDPQAVSLSVDTENLQLQKITEALNWYRFGGALSGSIPLVEWTGESLRSPGKIQVRVFGGAVEISNMEIENPFSAIRAIKLDGRFREVDLEQASQTFEFGQISGILEGQVNDLVITDGQPAQLRADVHSVEKSGVSQWISVESLNKITVLSSGNDAGAIYGGIAGLFENFRYSKLGFKATLKNDKLTLRGIESRDGKEFLVVGSLLPPTVNIISHTQEISFGELLRRLNQIQESDKPQVK